MIKMWISILLGQDCTLGRGSPLSDCQYVWKSFHQSFGASHLLLRGVQIEDASFPGRSSDAATCNSYTSKTSRDESEGRLKFASESCPPQQVEFVSGGNWEVFINGWSRWKATSWHFLGTPCHAWFLKHGFCLPVSVSCEESENSQNSLGVNKMMVSVLGGMLLQLWCRKV